LVGAPVVTLFPYTTLFRSGHRAADVIQRIRQLATKTGPHKARLDVNDVIRDVVPLIGTEVRSHEVSLRIQLQPALPPVLANRVQDRNSTRLNSSHQIISYA